MQGGVCLRDSIVNVLGANFIAKLSKFSFNNELFQFEGFVSKASISSTGPSHQLVIINNKPVVIRKVSQSLSVD